MYSSNVYGAAGAVVVKIGQDPVKIVARLGEQRMVTKTVNQSEIKIVPKTQN